MKRLLYSLMALLGFGFTSCEEGDGPFSQTCEYGTPTVSFRVTARVVDSEGNALQGIKVSMPNSFSDSVVYTNNTGDIDMNVRMFPEKQVEVVFEDVDGALNGGEFEELTMETEGEKVAEGDDTWDCGSYIAELGDVVMKRVEQSEE